MKESIVNPEAVEALSNHFNTVDLSKIQYSAITSTNVDDYTTAGIYVGTIANSITGIGGSFGVLIVGGSSSQLTQVVLCGKKIMHRAKEDGSWSSWTSASMS